MTKSPSTAMINQVRHDIHLRLPLLEDLSSSIFYRIWRPKFKNFFSVIFATSARIRFGRVMKAP